MVGGAPSKPWWFWPIILFFFCLVLGILAVMAGVGGGVLYVPLVSGFFPFHHRFCEGHRPDGGPGGSTCCRTGSAAPQSGQPAPGAAGGPDRIHLFHCRRDARLVSFPAQPQPDSKPVWAATIVGIAFLLLFSKNTEKPVVTKQDAIGLALGLQGVYWDDGARESVEWKTHRTLLGLFMFILIGLLAGMFGLGAGWANVPVLNLVMGVPLKVSVATSKFLLSITDTSAAWIYLNRGCVIPLIAVPSIVGLMLGSILGVRILAVAKPKFIRYMVISVLLFAGLKALDKGLGLGFWVSP
jgi:uncharacterized membrane protein YfcA